MVKVSYDLSIGEKIREIRKSKQLSLSEVSRLADVPLGSVEDIERGRASNPSFVSVMKICKALNISPLVLLGEENSLYSSSAEVNDIEYLFDIDYLNLFRDENFKKYFEVTKKAYTENIPPDILDKMLDTLITLQHHRD